MSRGGKIALVLAGITALGTGIFLYIRSIRPTEEMFKEWKKKSLAAGNDTFEGATLKHYDMLLSKWKKNLSKKEAQELIDNTYKGATEDMVRPLLEKLMGTSL
jgi:hypothetical protein